MTVWCVASRDMTIRGAPVALTLIAGVRTCLRILDAPQKMGDDGLWGLLHFQTHPFVIYRVYIYIYICIYCTFVHSYRYRYKILVYTDSHIRTLTCCFLDLVLRPEGDLCESGRATLPWTNTRFCRATRSPFRPLQKNFKWIKSCLVVVTILNGL